MKKVVVLMLMLGVAGCQTTGGSQTISEIQNAVKAACAFVPTAQTIAALLGKNLPYADIVSSICVAVGATGGRGPHATFVVKGVAIHGRFVK